MQVPGGLAEGFSSLRRKDGSRIFEIALSVEKESSAFSTLRLRSFYRQFPENPPKDYYAYLAGQITKKALIDRFPKQWAAAVKETVQLELGAPDTKNELDRCLDEIRSTTECETILIGGPPCQAYSLVGRARNQGKLGYEAAKDHRHFLYQEYIRIIGRLRPAAFVMENVKGILSSKINGEHIFKHVLSDMREAGGSPDSYTLVPVVSEPKSKYGEYVIRSEDYGIPQKRHRVIVIGVRSDLAQRFPNLGQIKLSLDKVSIAATVADAIAGLPVLRSGLSKSTDTAENWHHAVVKAFEVAAEACLNQGGTLKLVGNALSDRSMSIRALKTIPPRASHEFVRATDPLLASWLSKDELLSLPNHQTRGHMEGDLARYAFAATFADIHGQSPKAKEFPKMLAPNHANWKSGKFADRFRVQHWLAPSSTITSHISKDGHYFIHPDPLQCRSLTVREAARLQTFPDDYFFEGNRTEQYVQVGNAVPPLLARKLAQLLNELLTH